VTECAVVRLPEREKEREIMCLLVCQRENIWSQLCVSERGREIERERERGRRERESVCVRLCLKRNVFDIRYLV